MDLRGVEVEDPSCWLATLVTVERVTWACDDGTLVGYGFRELCEGAYGLETRMFHFFGVLSFQRDSK